MKKISGKFIGCLVYLCIGVFISLIYILCAATNNLEVTENTMGAIPSAIIFTCCMVLPPLIWMIYILAKKQVYNVIDNKNEVINDQFEEKTINSINSTIPDNSKKSINIEDKRLRIENQLHQNSVYILDKIIDKFLNEDKLNTIINNYLKTHTISLFVLEFCALPLIKVQDKVDLTPEFYFALKFYNCDSQYFNFVKKFNRDLLNSYEKNVKIAFDMRNYYYDNWQGPIVGEFKGYQNLFQLIRNQKIIEIDFDEKLHYYAMLYLIYLKGKQYFTHLAEERLEKLDIELDSDELNIVEKLYKNDIPENIIIDTIWCINTKKSNYNDLINIEYPAIQYRITQIIQDIKEKEQLQKLLDTNSNKTKYSLYDIDLMSGGQFEHLIAYLFNQLGYKAEVTKLSGDQGIDVIATKGKTKIAIQAKCYSQTVGNHAIMEAVAGAKYYNADKVMVVTNNYFTKSAKELAQSNNVVLWDRQILKEKLEEI